jgi:SAM-dependent methyltransferase
MSVAPSPRTDRYVHPDQARRAAFQRVYDRWLVVEDMYPGLARRFEQTRTRRFAELGGGRGPVSALLGQKGVSTCVIDVDPGMVAEAHRPSVRADIRALPLPNEAVDGIAAVNCLYFLTDPVVAVREAWRALRRGGLFVASCPSRWNDPELEGIDPHWGAPSSFDSEDAPGLISTVFGPVEVQAWKLVAYVLPDETAIADYLHAFNVPDWAAKAKRIEVPLNITKVGAHVWAHR